MFDVNINNLPAYQALPVYPIAKFLLQLQIHKIWMRFFEIKKLFHLSIMIISTLKWNALLFLIKLSTEIRFRSFLLDSSSKAKIFQNFFCRLYFYFLIDFEMWDFLAWSKPRVLYASISDCRKCIQLFSILLFYRIKIIALDKSLICNCDLAI